MEEPGKLGEAHFAWLETATQGPRAVYGHVQTGGGHLRLETQSRTRLQLGRGLLEAHAGRLLKHQDDAYQSLDEIKRQAAASGEPRERAEPIPAGVEREMILQMKANHYARWPDAAIPHPGLWGGAKQQHRKELGGVARSEQVRMAIWAVWQGCWGRDRDTDSCGGQ